MMWATPYDVALRANGIEVFAFYYFTVRTTFPTFSPR